ncbi:PREDICTED: beta-2-glycoprotein 1 isoform X2 [Myotis brandtii]|uniref:beta-2-glycoprotein 1 isoform X2 n=1 Tax=Myotis brandtii TaxID=109478 RepID=UPI0003BB77C1|nr:PREDICTED: beta-2-glycoprotein 1 isoform X2 [Myotis brandtii]
MISPALILFSSFLCHVAVAGRTCPRPDDVPFATVTPLRSSYDPGEQIMYFCKPGYVSRGGMRRFTCPLTGIWPINTLRCTPRVCPFAGILENGAVRYTTFEYPNTISFSCNNGFFLNGTKSAQCTEEGIWSPNLPVCSPVTCPPPPTPKFAVLSAYEPLAGNRSVYGKQAVFKCLPNYAMFGNDTATCTAHGNWTELPECREVKCPFPIRPDNGFVNYPAKEALSYKDKATYGCHDTYVLDGPEEVECNKFGNWSAQPSCKASCKVSVKKATVIFEGERVKIQEKFKNGMLHGQKVSFFCKNKEKKCSYTEDAQCIDGTFEVPSCFKGKSNTGTFSQDSHLPLTTVTAFLTQ